MNIRNVQILDRKKMRQKDMEYKFKDGQISDRNETNRHEKMNIRDIQILETEKKQTDGFI